MMKKILFFMLFVALLNAKPIASIVASVNNEPITSIDLIELSTSMKINENEALQALIKNKIILSQAKKFQLGVNQIELEEELQKLADKNNLSLDEFKANYKTRLTKIKENLKNELLKQKLFRLIAQNNAKDISDDEAYKFYNLNKDKMNNATYDQAKEQIKAYLMNTQAQEAINSYLEKEESKASIKIFR